MNLCIYCYCCVLGPGRHEEEELPAAEPTDLIPARHEKQHLHAAALATVHPGLHKQLPEAVPGALQPGRHIRKER